MQPDFVIIGAMKCGTSTLATQLGQQDGIFMTDPKEPNFFSDNDQYARGREYYQELFTPALPNDIKGEASTHYTKLPTYPETVSRMIAALDQPKLIYMVRNPIARAVSHYIHEWSTGVIQSDIETALENDAELVDYGCYGRQIMPFVTAFGAENIYLTSLEEVQADPQTALAGVCRFLGHESAVKWHEEQAQMNRSAERIRKFPMHGLLFDNPVARAARRALVPQRLRDKIKQSRQMSDRPEMSEQSKVRLQGIFAKDREILAGIFPTHSALQLCYPFVDDE
ncbi:sulfotransferase [Roseovarius sp. EL26]|uniref:sulfotransferase family protein n=1 Tax=Roseovarius sp. EL26 TaxID=2126672 RepID=UPI0020B11669|nr:sulfotransferase [Roseovarius sp. EL26]